MDLVVRVARAVESLLPITDLDLLLVPLPPAFDIQKWTPQECLYVRLDVFETEFATVVRQPLHLVEKLPEVFGPKADLYCFGHHHRLTEPPRSGNCPFLVCLLREILVRLATARHSHDFALHAAVQLAAAAVLLQEGVEGS